MSGVNVKGEGTYPILSKLRGSDYEQIVSAQNNIEAVSEGSATVTTAATRVQLSTVSCVKVDIQAKLGNTGIIVVGGSGVVASSGTRKGIALNAGDSYLVEVRNLNLLWIDSTVSGEGITYTVFSST